MATHVGLNSEVLEGCTRSELQRAQSKLNGAKSRGPKTIAGRERSKINATKLGLRARTLVLPGESAEDYQHWVQCTIKSLKPRDEFEHRLACRTADAEWVRVRALNAQHAQLATYIDEADAREDDKIFILCKTLFWDPRGPHAAYGISPKAHGGPGSSSSNGPDDPTDPHLIVGLLERSPKGCDALITHWRALLSRIKENLGWQAPDRLKAIRMLRKQPISAGVDETVASIYVACFAIKPGNRISGFGDLKCDMGTLDYKKFLRRARKRWAVPLNADDAAVARQWLIDLAERNIERLEARLEVYRQCADVRKERKDAADRFDDTPLGERLRRCFAACDRGLSRSLADFRNVRKNNWEEGGEIWTGDVVAADGKLANETEMEVGGAEDWVGSDVVAAGDCENVTNEPERDGECGEAAIADENVANEPERDGNGVGACDDTAGDCENVTNEPEREGDLVDAEVFAAVENENVTNEPEREGGGVGA